MIVFASTRKNRLSFERRLHYSWEYRRFFAQNQVFRLAEATVFRIPNDLSHYRLGITLKARGSSVERNKVKRQVREFFRQHADDLGSFDYNVVIPQTKKMQYPYPQRLKECFQRQFFHALSRSSSR